MLNPASQPNAASQSADALSTPDITKVGGAVPAGPTPDLDKVKQLAPLAQQIREDPVALQRLGDRVFQLLEQELRLQRERSDTHRRQRL